MIAEIITRLKANAPSLNTRVEGAASFAALVGSKKLPQRTPAAHVIPISLDGGRADAATGAFEQDTTETFGVIFTVRSSDPVGDDKREAVEVLTAEIIAAIAGWAPGDQIGVFRVVRGSLRSALNGAFVYQIDFRISDQLRILS